MKTASPASASRAALAAVVENVVEQVVVANGRGRVARAAPVLAAPVPAALVPAGPARAVGLRP